MSTTQNAINSPSLSNISPSNNAILVTNGSGVGSFSTALPFVLPRDKGGTGITGNPTSGALLVGTAGGAWAIGGLDSADGSVSFATTGGGTLDLSVNFSGTGFAVLNASNVFTGATNFFNTVNTTFANITGPSATSSFTLYNKQATGPFTNVSFTLAAFDTTQNVIQLNGSGAGQSVTLPTGSALEAILLSPFPVGHTISVGYSLPVTLISNLSATATVTLNANTDFALSLASATIPPNITKSYYIVKTASEPGYTLYG